MCVRRDDTREQAEADGFEAHDVEAANDADVICILVPDDVIPLLPLAPRAESCVIVASGYLDDERPVDVDRAFAKPFRPDLLERELARLASGD